METVESDGTVLYPDCGGSFVNLYMCKKSQNFTTYLLILLYVNIKHIYFKRHLQK